MELKNDGLEVKDPPTKSHKLAFTRTHNTIDGSRFQVRRAKGGPHLELSRISLGMRSRT